MEQIPDVVVDALRRTLAAQAGKPLNSAELRNLLNHDLAGSAMFYTAEINYLTRAVDNGVAQALAANDIPPFQRTLRAVELWRQDSSVPAERGPQVVETWQRALSQAPVAGGPTEISAPRRRKAALLALPVVALLAVIGALLFLRGDDKSTEVTTDSVVRTTISESRDATPQPTTASPASTAPTATTATTRPAAVGNGEFVSLTPTRVVDSRAGSGVAAGKVTSATVDLNSALRNAPSKAVVLNITVADPTGDGYLTVSPAGTDSQVSQLAFNAGRVVSSLVVTKTTGGKIDLRMARSDGHVLVDLLGYYAQSPVAEGLSLVAEPRPLLVFDSRASLPIAPQGNFDFRIDASLRGALLGVTVTGANADGYATVYSAAAPERPAISTVNFAPGADATGLALVSTSEGRVRIFNGSAGTINVAIFQLAKLMPGNTPSLTLNLDKAVTASGQTAGDYPFRLLDSRAKGTTCSSALGAGIANINTTFPKAKALLLSITVTGASVPNYLQAYTGDSAPPGVATMNFGANEQRSNLAFVPLTSDSISILCGGGNPSYIVDVLGAFE